MKKQKFLLIALIGLLLLLCSVPARAAGMNLVRDEEIERDMKIMCTPVFEQAGVSPQTVRFVLVEDDELNAFVAGGQNIFVNTGLILKTGEPMELVGVVAHETGHIALGHLFRSQEMMEDYSMQALLAGAVGIVAGIGARSGEAGVAAAAAGQGMALRDALGHSRTQEASADQAGVRFLEGANLPVTGMEHFMEKLEGQELLPEGEQSEYVRDHPLTQDRVDFLKHAAEDQAARGMPRVPAGWAEMHSRIKAKLTGYLYPDHALQDRSETTDARYARAIAWYRKGQIPKSMPLLDELTAAEPQNPYFYELKGQALFEEGHVDDSIPAYAKAVALLPRAGLIRAAYGRSLLESKNGGGARVEEAVRQLRLSLDTEPESSSTWHGLAVGYGRLGQEGQSRLALAEEYVLEGKIDLAKQEAQLAMKSLPPGSPAYLRAEDLLSAEKKVKKPRRQ